MAMGWRPLTGDTNAEKVDRVKKALKRAGAAAKSNREHAEQLRVDEATVRKYRSLLGVPGLEPGSGRPRNGKRKRR
jgi:hypothetical protein